MLVGRDAELAVLDALIRRAKAGAGGVVLLTGEPGVGKTRLARAGTEHADTMVSWGACRESEGAPPLWPWIQVLRHLGGPGITAGAAEGAAARFRLYERVAEILRKSAKDRPHLVVIDDLHRADEASLRLLAYLSETLWPASIGLVVTYRDTEVPPASLIANVAARPGPRTGPSPVRADRAEPRQRRAMAGRRRSRTASTRRTCTRAPGGTRYSSPKAFSCSPTGPGLTPRCAASGR